ncbi:cystatin-like fold lipoprotein [Staphylococcus epidermidis]|nr:cystatin-like fold lipoprotein [Staphylococcus epidermidis]
MDQKEKFSFITIKSLFIIVLFIEKEKVNRYVFKDGKLIIISYKLFKNKEQLFYVAYEIKGEKVYYKRDINPKDYIKEHKPDCKDIRRK